MGHVCLKSRHMIRKGVGQPLPDFYNTYNSKSFGKWVHWYGFGLCSHIGSNMGSNIVPNIVPYIVPNMDFLGFSSIFIGGNGSGTDPWTCFSAFGNGSGTVPWTCFSAFDPIHKDRSKKQKDHSSKTKQKQFLQNLQVSAKGWGDYTCSLSIAQREQVNVGERVKLDVEFAKIKDTFLHTSNSRSLDFFVLFQASSAERILIERESIFERWELDEQCRFWFAHDKLINKILPWNCCRHIADDWWFVLILDAWHTFKDDMESSCR